MKHKSKKREREDGFHNLLCTFPQIQTQEKSKLFIEKLINSAFYHKKVWILFLWLQCFSTQKPVNEPLPPAKQREKTFFRHLYLQVDRFLLTDNLKFFIQVDKHSVRIYFSGSAWLFQWASLVPTDFMDFSFSRKRSIVSAASFILVLPQRSSSYSVNKRKI